ncbi:hypothetical protein SKAU_G00416470 [Synaphobranchus kaupii]|uniref:UPAR/Ly6 domain-containing protein n=1 Tax=Synaphobranchus kaupii TaxID=118154 RepID=A0A9Q1E7G0_SYNKA|nr:hypothetical protein SKAU_G00416470 [Synaphobranchus kaupii]
MNTGLTFFLVITLFCFAADALECYVCSSSSSNTVCNQKTQNCSGSDDTCMTTVTHVVGIQSIQKACSLSVPCMTAAANSISFVIGGNTVTCCTTDLCNVNGFAITRLNVLLLVLPAALLVMSFGTS